MRLCTVKFISNESFGITVARSLALDPPILFVRDVLLDPTRVRAYSRVKTRKQWTCTTDAGAHHTQHIPAALDLGQQRPPTISMTRIAFAIPPSGTEHLAVDVHQSADAPGRRLEGQNEVWMFTVSHNYLVNNIYLYQCSQTLFGIRQSVLFCRYDE